MRLAMPDGACKSIDVPLRDGRKVRYQPDATGSVEVRNPRHVKLLREAECFVATGHTIPRAPGFPCNQCGHGSLFRRCGKCGADNPKADR